MIVSITDLSRSGNGVAKDSEGRILFIPFTAPGDEVEVELTQEFKNYRFAKVLRWVKKSPNRVEPRCLVFTQCGGCALQHIPYPQQFDTKFSGVVHALRRVQVTPPFTVENFPAVDPWNYRNRIQLRGFGAEVGFFAAGSRTRVPIHRCEISREEINQELPAVRKKGQEYSSEFKVEIDVISDGTVRTTWNARHAALGFRQVNDAQNLQMKKWISDAVPSGGELLDLYGGSGNLSWDLANRRSVIHCVDVSSPSQTLPEQPRNFHFHRMPSDRWIKEYSKKAVRSPDRVVILDPPRDGLRTEFGLISRAFKKIGVQRIIAVGCDPDAWARDMRHWIDEGYRFSHMAVFDFFPQTPHVESAGILDL